jgi:hypothetical protein
MPIIVCYINSMIYDRLVSFVEEPIVNKSPTVVQFIRHMPGL